MKKKKAVSLEEKVRRFFDLDQAHVVTFVFADGTKLKQKVNKAFLYTEKGVKKTVSSIVGDIHALSHDLNAKYFIV